MSNIKELIAVTNKNARKSRAINNVLWGVVVLLVIVSFLTAFYAVETKHEVVRERDAKNELLLRTNKLKDVAELLVEDLKISEENLQGEKVKLEIIKISYDSLRQVHLEIEKNTYQLWDYAQDQNTVEAYTDYIKLRGDKDGEVLNKIKELLTKKGYVQIQESTGELLIEPVEGSTILWKAKTARSIRVGVIGKSKESQRKGDVVLKGQPFILLKDSIWSGKTRWSKIAY